MVRDGRGTGSGAREGERRDWDSSETASPVEEEDVIPPRFQSSVIPTTAGLRSVNDTPHPGGGHRRVATTAAGTVRPVVGGVDAERGHGTSVERVHRAEGADHVRVHGCAVAEPLEVQLQGLVLALLVHAGCNHGVFAVLVRDDDVHDDTRLLGIVDDGDVGAQESWSAGDLLVTVHGASGARVGGFQEAGDDRVVAQGHGTGVGVASAEDVGGGLGVVATSSAASVAVSVSAAAIQREHVEAGSVDESPVAESGEVATCHEVVGGRVQHRGIEHASLVGFLQQRLEFLGPEGTSEQVLGGPRCGSLVTDLQRELSVGAGPGDVGQAAESSCGHARSGPDRGDVGGVGVEDALGGAVVVVARFVVGEGSLRLLLGHFSGALAGDAEHDWVLRGEEGVDVGDFAGVRQVLQLHEAQSAVAGGDVEGLGAGSLREVQPSFRAAAQLLVEGDERLLGDRRVGEVEHELRDEERADGVCFLPLCQARLVDLLQLRCHPGDRVLGRVVEVQTGGDSEVGVGVELLQRGHSASLHVERGQLRLASREVEGCALGRLEAQSCSIGCGGHVVECVLQVGGVRGDQCDVVGDAGLDGNGCGRSSGGAHGCRGAGVELANAADGGPIQSSPFQRVEQGRVGQGAEGVGQIEPRDGDVASVSAGVRDHRLEREVVLGAAGHRDEALLSGGQALVGAGPGQESACETGGVELAHGGGERDGSPVVDVRLVALLVQQDGGRRLPVARRVGQAVDGVEHGRQDVAVRVESAPVRVAECVWSGGRVRGSSESFPHLVRREGRLQRVAVGGERERVGNGSGCRVETAADCMDLLEVALDVRLVDGASG
ncbi:hypothetical protein WR25_15001 [Diploscapter pachys]|uniref:Uncharacterized protein n=1 Tax=Diploscapter pachys TaxID=2018661 RepID=A0A2A2LNR6_9BILA|nr:hypothetical protein WR25_15001 [Diploscapter pachys]